MASLALEPAPDAMCHVKMVLRMPDGQHTRRFLHSSQLESVFEFVEALTGDEARHFQLVATYPRRVFGFESVKKSLQELGLNTRQETLFVERVVESVPDIDEIEESDGETPDDCNELPDAWKVARQILEKRLDESMNSTISPAIHAMEPIMPVAQSADQEMKWQAQLNELDEMGFSNRSLNIEILERYQGRLLRVVNFLSEMGAAFDSSNGATVEY
ncbi:Predicted regulator of the ubiquitin pathway (contains UAS and UBX domains) [Plasmopara halstedii]|uniref:Predicted regulator of the ubiquitin pathway (Contains UAS and UBX domains) n=1 Tax=Plasmopara halstedii TaxID=4781 RepID=A0A0P1ALV5_PLAHL|nr:Predicted regulator of the ubiquitin pathway (contains UAS and UBX domains) [Plasmopara halstedii]CEG41878.1 Predicted regulator of the ubiquitin pathway (contains UAS and UBX domains) [Plasmopara halstedii]|eukprot:XP_024578247.1 Predicted regulator of the ubiquitin pathway (contains UAS and UBX domains) [Plasmopara halstedii]